MRMFNKFYMVFTGAFQYGSELHTLRLYHTTNGINILATEIIYFLFILYYMFLQVSSLYYTTDLLKHKWIRLN